MGDVARDAVARAARSRRGAAGDGLCDRADRLPGLRRRRLRKVVLPRPDARDVRGLEAAVGDELSARARCRRRPGVKVQPTPIYETLAMGLVAWWLWRMRDRFRPGALFALYMVLSGIERLLVEFLRRNHRIALGLTAPQLESIALMILGALWLEWMRRHGGVGAGPAGRRPPRVRSPRPSMSNQLAANSAKRSLKVFRGLPIDGLRYARDQGVHRWVRHGRLAARGRRDDVRARERGRRVPRLAAGRRGRHARTGCGPCSRTRSCRARHAPSAGCSPQRQPAATAAAGTARRPRARPAPADRAGGSHVAAA